MAHNLFGERFVSVRVPAWHKLGRVLEEPVSATQAWNLAGPYEVGLEDLVASPSGPIASHKAIIRRPCPGDPEHKVFAVVSAGYQLITPAQFCDLWDRHVKHPIETLGALGQGETFFVSTKLPSFAVKRDEVDNYMLGISPMTGKEAIQIRVTPVRVVCQNTLVAAQWNSSETYRVMHTRDARAQLEDWLEQVWDLAEAKAATLKEAFEAMASKRIDQPAFSDLLSTTYPEPRKPDARGLERETASARLGKWKRACQANREAQTGVKRLYDGEGRGFDAPATQGTAWGFWNAVVEYEDHGRKKPSAVWALFGHGAQIKRLAFDAALALNSK